MAQPSSVRELITLHEGRVPYAYQDSMNGACPHCGTSQGYWTIGVGHLIDRRKGGGLPETMIDALLEYDISQKRRDLFGYAPWMLNLDPVRQAVMLDMAFNLGVPGLMAFHNTLTALQANQYGVVSQEMLNSRWARQVGARSARLSAMMKTGRWPSENA